MLRLLRAGIVAAVRQIFAAAALTIFAAFIVAPNDPVRFVLETMISPGSGPSLLAWAYLMVAVGCGLSIGESTETAASRFRHAVTLMPMSQRRLALVAILAQSVICAIALAILALQKPPGLIVRSLGFFAGALAVPLVWSATLSIGVAFFCANALAAHGALEK